MSHTRIFNHHLPSRLVCRGMAYRGATISPSEALTSGFALYPPSRLYSFRIRAVLVRTRWILSPEDLIF